MVVTKLSCQIYLKNQQGILFEATLFSIECWIKNYSHQIVRPESKVPENTRFKKKYAGQEKKQISVVNA